MKCVDCRSANFNAKLIAFLVFLWLSVGEECCQELSVREEVDEGTTKVSKEPRGLLVDDRKEATQVINTSGWCNWTIGAIIIYRERLARVSSFC